MSESTEYSRRAANNGEIRSEKAYTTGEAAKLCGLSVQKIIECFENGTLKGFKIPNSRYRRIPRGNLLRFMQNHNIPIDALEVPNESVALLVQDNVFEEIRRLCPEANLRYFESPFEMGLAVGELPGTVVIQESCSPPLIEILKQLRMHCRDLSIAAIADLGMEGTEDLSKLGLQQIILDKDPETIAAALAKFLKSV